ncbi:MAG TPA: MFS transporter [Dehalococcoidales bacterium]|nr:MFS transporter [Dehalococcoidales bacterium]
MSDAVPESNQAEVSPWALFTHLDFFFLWSSGVATTISTLIFTLISSQWLYDTTGSAAQLGLLGVVQFAQLPVALYGGMLADRLDRKKLLVLTQLANSLLIVILTILAAGHNLEPWHIFAVTGITGMVSMLGSSSRPAMLPRVVPRGLVTHAITTLNVSSQTATVVGPIVFWQAYDRLGVAASLGISAAICLSGSVLPLLIRASGKPEVTPHQNTWTLLKEGGLFVKRHSLLPGLYLLDMGVTVVSFYRQLFPVFARQLYGLGAQGTGLLNTANAIGGILGALAVFFTGRVSRKGVVTLAGTLVYAVFLIAFGVNRNFALGLIIVGTLGMTDTVSMVMRSTIVQLTTPDKLLGRASSIGSFVAMGSNNLGQVEVGLLSAAIGAGQTMLIGGVLSVIFVLMVWRFIPGIRQYRYDV